ncbi:MAG: ABC transporter ATP-binding protein [Bacteroidales bacterium]|nr:ABC transporter ATP-binding protein [Bacteroidales bacterium]
MLKVKNVSFAYRRGGRQVLSDYSLTIPDGTICGLLGPNGAGKSTLLSLIAGLLRTKTGTIDYNGHNPAERSVEFLSDIFFVPEEFELPNIPLSTYLECSAPFYPRFSMDALTRHLATFEMTPDVHLGRLSMGQKKRVFLSFALACNTSLLLLDEPTNGLDIPGKRLFRKAVLSGMTDDRTVIISTHQVYDVDKILDHIVITDTAGVLLDESVNDITSRLKFSFTTDRSRAEEALFALDAPGGYNVVEHVEGAADETDVNLETLFEFTRQKGDMVKGIFRK